MDDGNIQDYSIFVSGNEELTVLQDTNENNRDIRDNAPAINVKENDSNSIGSPEVIVVSPGLTIVDNSYEQACIDRKHVWNSENDYATEAAIEEIGLINYNCVVEKSGCDVLENKNSNDVAYDSLLNKNVCLSKDNNNNVIDEEAALLIRELVAKAIQANEMYSNVETDEEDIGDVNLDTISKKESKSDDKGGSIVNAKCESVDTLLDVSHSQHINICLSSQDEHSMEIEVNSELDNISKYILSSECEEITQVYKTDKTEIELERKLEDIMDESYLVSYLLSDADNNDFPSTEGTIIDSVETEDYSENISDDDYTYEEEDLDKKPEIIHEDFIPQVYLDKSKAGIDLFQDDVFTTHETFVHKKEVPHIPTLSTSEIMVFFPRVRTSSGRPVSVDYDEEKPAVNVRTETEINIPFRGEKRIRNLSTSSLDLLAQTYLMKGRFVSGLMSVNMKSLQGVEKDTTKKWCYILRSADECENRQWRYNIIVDRQPCQLSFQVIEDPNAVERWETSTFELMSHTKEKLQFESEWVLINCNHKDIELFTAHENEVIELSYQQQSILQDDSPDKKCAVS